MDTGMMGTSARLMVLWVPDWPVAAHARGLTWPTQTHQKRGG